MGRAPPPVRFIIPVVASIAECQSIVPFKTPFGRIFHGVPDPALAHCHVAISSHWPDLSLKRSIRGNRDMAASRYSVVEAAFFASKNDGSPPAGFNTESGS